MKISTILIILLLSSIVTPHFLFPTKEASVNPPSITLSMFKLKTNATGISACTLNISQLNGTITKVTGTLFGKIRIIVNVTLINSNNTYVIALNSFTLTVTQKNIVIGNSTDTSQFQNPTNTITNITIFPNVPVILVLSFRPACVIPNSVARLNYLDSVFNFVFDLP